MKIRSGFVSNSSSSSFVMAVHRSTHNKAMSRLPEKYKKIIKQTVEFQTAFGIELAVRWQYDDAGGNSNYSGSLDARDYDGVFETLIDEAGDQYEEYLLFNAIEAYDRICCKLEPDYFSAYLGDGG